MIKENNNSIDHDESNQVNSTFPTAENISLYTRIKNEIAEKSTTEVAKTFADSQQQAESGNYAEAVQLITSLALSGNVYAQMLLYEYYSHLDRQKDAIMWLQRASKQHQAWTGVTGKKCEKGNC